RECLDLRGRAARRAESTALSGLGAADRAGSRGAEPQPAVPHGAYPGPLLSVRRALANAGWNRALPNGRPDAHRRRRAGTRPGLARDAVARAGAARSAGIGSLVLRGRRRAGRTTGGRVVAQTL